MPLILCYTDCLCHSSVHPGLLSDCHFLLSGFWTSCKASQYPNPIVVKACSLIHNFQLIFYSSGYCCSEFPNPQILHALLDLLLCSRQNIYCLLPQEGPFPLYIPIWCLFSVFQWFACSYLDCSRWEGLWPALNLTKIKQSATWIIYFLKVSPSYLLHILCTKSPHPDHLLRLTKVLFSCPTFSLTYIELY